MKKPSHLYRSILTAPRVLRVLAGLALIAGGLVGFLPILGFWMVPLGVLVIFFDLPFVRAQWWKFRAWWKGRRGR